MATNKKGTGKVAGHADLSHIMNPKSVAIVGASNNPDKVGHVIMQNYLDVGYPGSLYPVNMNADGKIMGHDSFKRITDIRRPIDLAVIAVKAEAVPQVLEDCGKAGVKGVIVVSSGFAEVGNVDLQEKFKAIALKYKLPVIGPNCLGVMDPRSRVDTLFLPTFKIDRPKIGGVSFASQSGAVGSTVLDLISSEGFGLSRFISYGNAAVVDEVDILDYLAKDPDTRVAIFYIEGVNRGREFIDAAKRASKAKPIVIKKGGMTPLGATAAHSHTAALTGNSAAYTAIFKQCGMVIADDLSDLLHFAKVFETEPLATGKRVAVITNGGGAGVLVTDALYEAGLGLAELSPESERRLRKSMPPIVNIRMPLDIGGDAGHERFSEALEVVGNDPNVDALIVISLFQTPGADENVASKIVLYKNMLKKPLIVLCAGGKYTMSHREMLESSGVPVYDSPSAAARSLAALINYSRYKMGDPDDKNRKKDQ